MFARGKSYLVVGEAGTGKSSVILTEAKRSGSAIFRWNARIDRSLREGREVLHTQVRSKEALFVWIEGVDDLTQEAQAFMRRILETASKNVTCVLEAREVWKLSQPILSRCLILSTNQEMSFRKRKNNAVALELGLIKDTKKNEDFTYKGLHEKRMSSEDPYELLESFFKNKPQLKSLYQNTLRAIGSGKSPWIQLAHAISSVE
jgi:DNA polymerase III delta prime subunit